MQETDDTRWLQRFDSYKKVLVMLKRPVLAAQQRKLNEIEVFTAWMSRCLAFRKTLWIISVNLDDLNLPWNIEYYVK